MDCQLPVELEAVRTQIQKRRPVPRPETRRAENGTLLCGFAVLERFMFQSDVDDVFGVVVVPSVSHGQDVLRVTLILPLERERSDQNGRFAAIKVLEQPLVDGTDGTVHFIGGNSVGIGAVRVFGYAFARSGNHLNSQRIELCLRGVLQRELNRLDLIDLRRVAQPEGSIVKTQRNESSFEQRENVLIRQFGGRLPSQIDSGAKKLIQIHIRFERIAHTHWMVSGIFDGRREFIAAPATYRVRSDVIVKQIAALIGCVQDQTDRSFVVAQTYPLRSSQVQSNVHPFEEAGNF